jgi:hypothetical protein
LPHLAKFSYGKNFEISTGPAEKTVCCHSQTFYCHTLNFSVGPPLITPTAFSTKSSIFIITVDDERVESVVDEYVELIK